MEERVLSESDEKRSLLRPPHIVLAAIVVAGALAIVTAATVADTAEAREQPREDQYQGQIIGGKDVPDGKYPFMASLQDASYGDTPKDRHFCGGTLISPYQVLTAAHCVEAIGDGKYETKPEDLRIVVGRTALNSDEGQVGKIRNSKSVSIHPKYSKNVYYDVAVIELKQPIEGIEPIGLATTGTDALERPGRKAIAAGWGNTIAQPYGPGPGAGLSEFPNRLQEAELPIVSDEECATSYTGEGGYEPDLTVCAGKTAADACQGDSGGPLFVATAEGRYRQIGVTSYGNGCGAPGFPGAWTQVSAEPIGNFIQKAAI